MKCETHKLRYMRGGCMTHNEPCPRAATAQYLVNGHLVMWACDEHAPETGHNVSFAELLDRPGRVRL